MKHFHETWFYIPNSTNSDDTIYTCIYIRAKKNISIDKKEPIIKNYVGYFHFYDGEKLQLIHKVIEENWKDVDGVKYVPNNLHWRG